MAGLFDSIKAKRGDGRNQGKSHRANPDAMAFLIGKRKPRYVPPGSMTFGGIHALRPVGRIK